MTLSVLPHRDQLGVRPGRLFIDGEWAESVTGKTWTHVHPATNEEVIDFAVANEEDVDRAVLAARRAFDDGPWPKMPARERQKILQRVAIMIADNADEINQLQTLDNGLPVTYSGVYQLSAHIVADMFDHFAGWVDKLGGETLPSYRNREILTMTWREPLGVVAGILPWNAPLMLFGQKVAPALAAGCTLILKPSEYASLAVLRMTELLAEAGLPDGVLNVVLGEGPTTGEALIDHPGVDKITFTGSRAVGRHIMEVAGRHVKNVSLELGGKSPQVIFPDAPNVDLAAMTAMGGVAMGLSGQGCVIMTRTLVHREIYDQCVDVATNLAAAVRFGDPFDRETTSMPIINQRQMDRVMGYVSAASNDGARLVFGGDRPTDPSLADGNWVNPTLFADVDNSMTIAREEVFGPVLAMIPFDTEEEAITLANDTEYGLGATVWTSNLPRALRCARSIRAGTFGINSQTVMPNAPFGGYKESGIGREGGRAGIEEFTELKTVTVATGDSFT